MTLNDVLSSILGGVYAAAGDVLWQVRALLLFVFAFQIALVVGYWLSRLGRE